MLPWRRGSRVAKKRGRKLGMGSSLPGSGWGLLLGSKEGLLDLGKGPVGMKEGKGAMVKVVAGRMVWVLEEKLTPSKLHLLSRPSRVHPSGHQTCLSGDHQFPFNTFYLHRKFMADKGSGGSRLPLALPPASQGCSSGGSGSSAGGSGNPRPPRNLQGLLQMAITAGSEEPDPPPEPMSEEVKYEDLRSLGEGLGDISVLGRVA